MPTHPSSTSPTTSADHPCRRSFLIGGFGIGALSALRTLEERAVASTRPAPPRTTQQQTLVPLLIGARCNPPQPATFAAMNRTIGPVKAMRLFYPGSLPTQYAATSLPPGVAPFVSYKSPQTNVGAYIGTLPANARLTFHHEPEAGSGNGDFTSGQEFTGMFGREYAAAHAARWDIRFGMIAGAYQYQAGRNGYDGSYLPDPASCDFYGIDTYQRGDKPLIPLEQEPRFQRWYSLVRDRGRPLYITEYGRGLSSQPQANDQRAKVIAVDAPYLASIGVSVWLFWWAGGSAGSWTFSDQPSIDAWRKVALRNA